MRMDKAKTNDEEQGCHSQSGFDRLYGWMFAREPEPLSKFPTQEEFLEKQRSTTADFEVGVAISEYEHELERHQALADERKAFYNEISKTIRRVFYTLVGTCLFSIITLTGTPDVQLLTPEATVKLPVLNYDMGFSAFLIVGPAILIGLSIYLHIFVAQHRMLEVAPESRQPMLPNFGSWSAKLVVLSIFYWMVPLTLFVFAWKAVPSPIGPMLLMVAVGVTAALVLLQIRRCRRHSRPLGLPLLFIALAVFSIACLEMVKSRQLNLFKADLSGKDLRFADLRHAFLVEANLSGANLSGTWLDNANLTDANLTSANLTGAYLTDANLTGAKLIDANLTDANLTGANLTRVTWIGIEPFSPDIREDQ